MTVSLAAVNKSTTTNYEKSALMLLIILLPFTAESPKCLQQRGRKEDKQGKTGNKRLSARNSWNHPLQIRIPDHYGRRTL